MTPPCNRIRLGAPAHPLQIQREHKAAEKAGTRAPVKANGLPVKAPKPTSIVCNMNAKALSLMALAKEMIRRMM